MSTGYDFSPLYRSVIGADRMASLIEAAFLGQADGSYPPYDVEKVGDDAYKITVAAAGFGPEELEITAQPNLLVVAGRKNKDEAGRTFLHRGIAGRNFEKRFELADYVVVKSATHADGILSIELAREVPETLKPRTIQIAANGPAPTVGIEDQRKPRRAA